MSRWILWLGAVVWAGCDDGPPVPPTPAELCAVHQLEQEPCAAKVQAFLAPVDPLDGTELTWRFESGTLQRSGWRPMTVVETVSKSSEEISPAEVAALKPELKVSVGDTVGLISVTGHGHELTFAVPPDHPDAKMLTDVLGGFLTRSVPTKAGRPNLVVERDPSDHTLTVVWVRKVVWWWVSSEGEIARSDAQQIDPAVSAGDELRVQPEDHPKPAKVFDLIKHWLARYAPHDIKRIPSSMAELEQHRALVAATPSEP